MTGEADAELASNSGEASLGEGTAIAAEDAAEPPQPQPQKGWPSKRLPPDTRYFVMKSFSMRDILISLKKGIWATQSRNESKLNSAQSVRARCCCAGRVCVCVVCVLCVCCMCVCVVCLVCVVCVCVVCVCVCGPPPLAFRAARLRPRGCSPTPTAHPDTHALHAGLRVRHPLLLGQRVPGFPGLCKDGAPLPCRPLQLTRATTHPLVCCVCQTSRTGDAKEEDGSASLWTAVDGTQSWGGVFKVAPRPARAAPHALRAHCFPGTKYPRPRAHVAWRSPDLTPTLALAPAPNPDPSPSPQPWPQPYPNPNPP